MSIVQLDLQYQIKASSNLELLSVYLRPVIGVPFQKVAFGYGEELHLHFGELLLLTHPKLRNHSRGSYLLLCSDSDWLFKSPTQDRVVTNLNREPESITTESGKVLSEEAFEQMDLPAKGSTVSALHINHNLGLQLHFSDGTYFLLIPNSAFPNAENESSLPTWKLLMPNNAALQVGPDSQWSYLPASQQK